MGFENLIAGRHLKARKRRSLSVVTWLSVIGVALGVTALVGGFSVTSGFEQAFREKVLGVTAHVFVREYGLRFTRYRDAADAIHAVPGVKATSAMTVNEAMLAGRDGTTGAMLKGLVPRDAERVVELSSYMVEGSLRDLEGRGPEGLDRLVLGAELARKLGVKVGDAITVVSPLRLAEGDWDGAVGAPRTATLQVAGIFEAGFHEYDARLGYLELSVAQRLFGLGDAVLGIEVAVDDPLHAGRVAAAIRRSLGPEEYSVRDWRTQNSNLFASLTYQRIAILVVLAVMVVLASCNVAIMLIMLVLERTRDIAILKAMGAPRRSILRIFVTQGFVTGALGTAIGMVLAYGLCEGLLARGIPLDPKVYGIAHLPVVFDPWDYVMAAAGALVITFVAALFPALRGARMAPTAGLRETHAR